MVQLDLVGILRQKIESFEHKNCNQVKYKQDKNYLNCYNWSELLNFSLRVRCISIIINAFFNK